jgi:hypothetical protein
MFRVADLARDAALVPLASAKAIQMQDEDPDRADALVAFWSPGRQDYANV